MDPFLLKLILSFFVGGLYIALNIFVSEKFGSKIGGILLGLPSTTLVSLIFIAWTQGTDGVLSAVTITPFVLSIAPIFVVAFIAFYRFGAYSAFVLAFLTWLILILPVLLFVQPDILLFTAIGLIFFAISILLLNKHPHVDLKKRSFTYGEFAFRSIFAGLVIATAVLFGKLFGPLWGGIFASFPAAFSSSMFLLSKKHGIKFAASVSRTMPFGCLCTLVFVLVFFFSVPSLGMISGLVLSYLISLVAAIITYKLLE